MATIFTEGFDKYGPTGETSPSITTLLTQGEWTSTAYNFSVVAPLSSNGYALSMNTGSNNNVGGLAKTLSASYSTAIGGLRFQVSSLSGFTPIQFTDSGTAQSSISVNTTTGTISLRTGGTGNGSNNFPTAIATSTASIQANATHYLEWKVAIGASASYQVWLDGVSLFSGTGNTKTTGTSTYNGIIIYGSFGNSNSITIDDLYLFDTTGSFNNDVLLTSPRVETRRPTSDSQTQFTNTGNVIVPVGQLMTGVSTVTASTFGPGANFLTLMQITPSVNCTLQSVATTAQTTNGLAKFKAVLYADSAGAPGSLTATGTEVIGSTSGSALSMPFGSGQALTASTSYWIGYINDSAVNISEYNTTPASGTGASQRKANTYASGPPSPAGGSFTAGSPLQIWGVATGAATNWETVTCNPANGAGPAADTGSITSSTPGNEDLYGFPALSVTANLVYGIAVKGHMKRSDSGARTVDLRVKSSGVDSAGSTAGQSPGTTYAWVASYFDSDPNGPIAWTGTTANAATAGPKINS